MVLREQDKHFLWSLYAAVAVIFVWKGLWEGIYEIPYISKYIGNPWVFLFMGLAMLTFSGVIFKEFDPLGGVEKAVSKIMHFIQNHPHKEDFTIKYFDKNKKQQKSFSGNQLVGFEKGTLLIKHPHGQEIFVPAHRLTEVLYQGKPYWRL